MASKILCFTYFLSFLLQLAQSGPFYQNMGLTSERYVKRSAMPSPVEFWLCASDFNPFNLLISQPISNERCEVIPRDMSAALGGSETQNVEGIAQIQTFG